MNRLPHLAAPAWALIFGLTGLAAETPIHPEPGAPDRVARQEAPTPAVADILQRAVAALGGRVALEQTKTLHASGSAEAAHLGKAVSCELYGQAPNRRLLVFHLTDQGQVREVFDGERGWYEDPSFGRTDWTGEELAKRKRDATFLCELHLARLYPDLRLKGVESVENEPCHVLESRPTPDAYERFAFSRKTGLLVRQESAFRGGLGPVYRSVSFADYRPVGGILFPHRMNYRQRGGSQAEPEITVEVVFRKVRFDAVLPGGLFSRPEASGRAPDREAGRTVPLKPPTP